MVATAFECLPYELVAHILLFAVHERGIKRALRLRLVNRLFSTVALKAIFHSGLLDDDVPILDDAFPFLRGGIIWRRYMTFRTLSNIRPIPYQLRVLRRVAQRIAEYACRAEGRAVGHNDIEKCIAQLCEMSCVSRSNWWKIEVLNHGPRDAAPYANDLVDENEDYFKKSLFSAAVYLNHVDLIRELLPRKEYTVHKIRNCKHILGAPLRAAADAGNTEIASILLSQLTPGSDDYRFGRELLIRTSTWNGNLPLLELALTAGIGPRTLLDVMCRSSKCTASLPVFERLWPLIKPYLPDPLRKPRPDIIPTYCIPSLMNLNEPCPSNDLINHFLAMGAPVDGRLRDMLVNGCGKPSFCMSVSRAVDMGNHGTVRFLLGRGASVGCALLAATYAGSVALADVLYKHGAGEDRDVVAASLAVAITREDEGMARYLIAKGGSLTEEAAKKVRDKLREDGAISMEALIIEAVC